jgi:DNA-binding NarL/FixJ family response regulator
MKACRILIADGHGVVRRGLCSLFAARRDWEVVGEANGSDEAVEMAKFLHPDVVIMEILMPEVNALEAAKSILSSNPDIGIMLFTLHNNEQIFRMAVKSGIRGYVLKSDSEKIVIECVEKICEGGVYFSPGIAQEILASTTHNQQHRARKLSSLTARQEQVMKLLATGKTNKEVGKELGISARTVEAHRTQLMERLNVQNISGLVLLALRNHLIEL